MASIQIDYPDAAQARIVDALCTLGGWTPELGVARGAFAKRQIAEWVKSQVHTHERAKAQQEALSSVSIPQPPDVT